MRRITGSGACVAGRSTLRTLLWLSPPRSPPLTPPRNCALLCPALVHRSSSRSPPLFRSIHSVVRLSSLPQQPLTAAAPTLTTASSPAKPPTSPPSPSAPPSTPSPSPPPLSPVAALLASEKKPPLRLRLRQRLTDGRPRWRNFLILGLAGCASYAAFSVSVDLVVFLSSIRHAETLEVAYIAGAVVLASTLGFFSLARRFLPSPLAPLYRLALRRVKKHPHVQDALGYHLRFGPTSSSPSSSAVPFAASSSSLSTPSSSSSSSSSAASSVLPSGFRLVTRLPAGPRWSAEPGVVYWGWERYWKPRRAQFVVSVEGERGQSILLAQVEHRVDDRKVLRHLSVERIAPRNSQQPARIVIEEDAGGWSSDASASSRRS